MERALVADGVTKTYGDTVALDDVSVAVEEGEVLALVGPNGAGKTTLVRTLTGTTVPDEGTVRVLDAEPEAVDRASVGVLPQAFSPEERLTARELLWYYAGLYDEGREPELLLDELGLADAADLRYEALSGGQQRRVCLGAALVNDPRVVVLDEPTSGIDPAGRRTVREEIADLAAVGATVLLTTHDMDEAERVADRVALLADGRLRAEGTPAELIDEYGGPPHVVVEASGSASAAVEAIEAAGFDVECDGERLHVSDVATTAIGDVVGALDDADVAYEQLAWQRPTLEDAYMALAGSGGGPSGSVGADEEAATDGETATRGERA